MTLRDAIAQSTQTIARRDAETLALHLLRRPRAWLLSHPETPLMPVQEAKLRDLVRRRAAHEPLQYLTGQQEFYGLDLEVTPAVLIPRPETELLVEATLGWVAAQPGPESTSSILRLLDVGTGSGAIAIALAAHLPHAQVIAVDLSSAALALAKQNAVQAGCAKRIRFLHSDLLARLQPELEAGLRFDAVVSNPPYVPQGDAETMQSEVRDFEPHLALFAGEDGLEVYRRLIPQALQALRPGGLLAMEFGYGQREALRSLLPSWSGVQFLDDLAGIPRVVLATLQG